MNKILFQLESLTILQFFHNNNLSFLVIFETFMKLVRTLFVLSFLVFETWAWGDVIYYPEFIKYMEEIGNYNTERPVALPDLIDQKGPLNFSIIDLQSAPFRKKRLRFLNLMKRSFSTSQLRRR